MLPLFDRIRQFTLNSRFYRLSLLASLAYTVFRLALQGVVLGVMLIPAPGKTTMMPNDLHDYLEGAQALHLRQDLYIQGPIDRVEFFQYSPAFAWLFTIFLPLPEALTTVFHTLLHLVAYVALYWVTYHLFGKLNLTQVQDALLWMTPVWLLFSSFWTDLGYLNIYIIIALLALLFIKAVLEEKLTWALLWLSLILQTKPQWAFAVAVPLLMGRYRFFIRLIIGAVLIYVLIAGVTILAVGPLYGWQQYIKYVEFLSRMSWNFPWRGPDAPFLGYNHSIKQIVVYLSGVSSGTLRLADLIKMILLLPLLIVCLRYLIRPVRLAGHQMPQLALDLAFVLYLGAFIWLDMVWELSLGIVIFPYLVGTLAQRTERLVAGAAFLPYALLDPWRVFSFMLSLAGLNTVTPNLYVLTDPAIYVPLIMVVILVFYALLLKRLWRRPQEVLG